MKLNLNVASFLALALFTLPLEAQSTQQGDPLATAAPTAVEQAVPEEVLTFLADTRPANELNVDELRKRAKTAKRLTQVKSLPADLHDQLKHIAEMAQAELEARQQAAEQKSATDQAAQEQAAADKAAANQAAQEKAAADKAAKEQAAAVAATKAAQDQVATAAAKAAKEQAAADKAAANQAAQEQASADKAAKEQAAADKATANQVAQEQAAADKAAKEQAAAVAANKAAQDQVATVAAKAAKEQAAADKAAANQAAQEQAAADKAAKEQAAVDKAAANKAGQEQAAAVAANKAAQDQVATAAAKAAKEQAAADKAAANQAAQEQASADKAAKEQAAVDKAAANQVAQEQAAADKAAKEQAAAVAANKAAQDQVATAAAKAAQEQAVADKSAANQAAQEQAAADQAAKEQAAAVANKAGRDQVATAAAKAAQEQAVADKLTKDQATAEKAAANKAGQEQTAAAAPAPVVPVAKAPVAELGQSSAAPDAKVSLGEPAPLPAPSAVAVETRPPKLVLEAPPVAKVVPPPPVPPAELKPLPQVAVITPAPQVIAPPSAADAKALDSNIVDPASEKQAQAYLADRSELTRLSDDDLRKRLDAIRELMSANELARDTERAVREKLKVEREVLRQRVALAEAAQQIKNAQAAAAITPAAIPGVASKSAQVPAPAGSITTNITNTTNTTNITNTTNVITAVTPPQQVLRDTRPAEKLDVSELQIRIQIFGDAQSNNAYDTSYRDYWRASVERDRAILRRRLIQERHRRETELAMQADDNSFEISNDYVESYSPRDVFAAEIDQHEMADVLIAPPRRFSENPRQRYKVDQIATQPKLRNSISRIEIDTIRFGTNEAFIRDEQVRNLDAVAAIIEKIVRKYPNEVFLIEGHTDAPGSAPYNERLSKLRAESIKRALVAYYVIPAKNLRTVGLGKRFLKIPTAEAEPENRRVSIARITPLLVQR